jgi:hypothetical protein
LRRKKKLEEMKVEFTSKGQKKYRFKVIDYPRGFFEAKLSKETLIPGKMVELRIKPAKILPEGTVKKSISLQVSGEKEFRITIPVKTGGS